MLVDLPVLMDRFATALVAGDVAEAERIWDEWTRRKGLGLVNQRMRVALLEAKGDPGWKEAWRDYMQQVIRLSTHQPGAEDPEGLMALQTLEDWEGADPWDIFRRLMAARGEGEEVTPFDGWIAVVGLELWLRRRPRDPATLKRLADTYDELGLRTVAMAFDLLVDALGGAPELPPVDTGYPGWNELFTTEPPASPAVREQVAAWLARRRG